MKKYAQTLLYLMWFDLKRTIFKTKYFAEVDITDNATSGVNTLSFRR